MRHTLCIVHILNAWILIQIMFGHALQVILLPFFSPSFKFDTILYVSCVSERLMTNIAIVRAGLFFFRQARANVFDANVSAVTIHEMHTKNRTFVRSPEFMKTDHM